MPSRVGEPVLVRVGERWVPGYIEFVIERSYPRGGISVATEPGGARIVLWPEEIRANLKTDPDGVRPLRDARGIRWKAEEAEG